jgi:hypothetical protein
VEKKSLEEAHAGDIHLTKVSVTPYLVCHIHKHPIFSPNRGESCHLRRASLTTYISGGLSFDQFKPNAPRPVIETGCAGLLAKSPF